MAGRGRAPETLSPELIAALKHRYVETDQPVREIIAEFGISVGKLNRLIAKEGWPMRKDRPPRGLPPAVRLLEEARKLAEQPGSANGERSLASREREPTFCAVTTQAPTEDPAARIEQLVLKELAAEEAVRARLGHAPRGAADAERSARTLSILTQTLQNLQRLRASQASAPQNQFGSPDDDMPAGLDEFRRDLARRIDAFVASRADGGDAERERAGDSMATAR